MKTLITNATIIDGTNKKPFLGDILIAGNTIQKIFANNETTIANNFPHVDTVINAKDLYVTPGFIDMHSHSDLANFVPSLLKPKIMQGITTEVVGQCGFSVAPMSKAKQDKFKSQLIIGDLIKNWSWESMSQYLAALDSIGLESNLVPFVGHGTLRFAVASDEPRSLTNKEINELVKLAEESFAAGAFGASFGLIYVPAIFANKQELQSIINVTAKNAGLISVHLRSESDELLEALTEMIKLTSAADCRLHISHLKAIGKRNWPKLATALKIIAKNDITFDHYPYAAGSTTLLSIFPPFILQKITTLQELASPVIRIKLKNLFSGKEQLSSGEPWDNLPDLLGWQNIIVVAVNSQKNAKYIGCNLQEIATSGNKDPTDATIDLIVEENGQVRMIDYHSDENSIREKLQHQSGMIGTDTLYGGKLHPRVAGTYPKLFKEYVFAQKVISIETMVQQITAKPAVTLGLKNRGYILPGYKADLVIFDKNFADRATFAEPELLPQGLHHVIINGEFKVKNGVYQNNIKSGQVIRKTESHNCS